MTLVAVASRRSFHGVEGDADDFRATPGAPENCRARGAGPKPSSGVECAYEVADLGNALAEHYRTDAHLVAYVLRGPDGAPLRRQPRINKPGLPFVLSLGFTLWIDVLFADIDNPGHAAWTPETLAEAQREDEKLLATAGVYYTAHGRRIVQPLSRAVPIEEAEGVLAAFLRSLELLGFAPDPACRDWTRHFRLPNVVRKGHPYRSPRIWLERMRPIEPPAPLPGTVRRARAVGPRTAPAETGPLAQAFAAAGWLGRRIDAVRVAALCPWASAHTGGRDFDTSTVLFAPTADRPLGHFHCSHAHCSTRSQAEVIRALPPAIRRTLPSTAAPAPAAPPRELVPVGEARERLEEAFRRAPDGVTVAIAGCGTGKTEAALSIAAERAATPYASAKATGARAPAHSKTVISVPTTALAIDVTERARAKGLAVRRLFGVLSVPGPDGKPACRFYDAAAALARGGLSIPRLLCEGGGDGRCPYYDECPARGGSEGPDDARVLIGPHQLLGQLAGAAGSTGLVVIDEPPDLLEHPVLSAKQIEAAAKDEALRPFEYRYGIALKGAMLALAAWIATAPLDEPGPLARGAAGIDPALLEQAAQATGAPPDVVEIARAALEPGTRGSAPPVQRAYVAMARGSAAFARQIGDTARVLRLVWLGLTAEPGHVLARVEERGGERRLVLTLPNVELRETLRREGATVVADANGRIHLPVYERAVGYAPRVVEVHAADGAAVERTQIRARATRQGLCPGGQLVVGQVLVRAVRDLVGWALQDVTTQRLAIVTLKPVELALRAALGEAVATTAAAPAEALDAARRLLGPELARLPCRPDLNHYGAIRGLDAWKDHDALATLGDPWPQIGDVQCEADLLELGSWEARARDLAAAELEQAHGRLRLVHRTKPARALHVGGVTPSGWPETAPETPAARGMAAQELRAHVEAAGGFGNAMAAWGLKRASLARYLSGESPVPAELVKKLCQEL